MRASVFLLIAAALAGCASAAEQLRPRAAFDLQCPAEQLAFVDLGGLPINGALFGGGGTTTQGVTGCGKRATYVKTPEGWIMNTEQAPGQPQPGNAPPGYAPPPPQ